MTVHDVILTLIFLALVAVPFALWAARRGGLWPYLGRAAVVLHLLVFMLPGVIVVGFGRMIIWIVDGIQKLLGIRPKA